APNTKNKFGWVQVSGLIDAYEINQYKLMPMGNGKLFLPVKAEIRKKIKKNEGDQIRVTLFLDERSKDIPEEFLLCLEDEPEAKRFFETLSESERFYYIDWIYSAKKEDTKVERIVSTLNNLTMGKKFMERTK
ncbi:MAG TPA: YdeI/OmpD-associated family protein, partial [Cytophagales bacterium]|nr:YdeI/OmpD-associated family protein [Cytophagales bacterium]